MKCEKCGKKYESGNYCDTCGGKLIEDKTKFSGVTIISLIMLILSIVIPIILLIYSMIGASSSGNDAYGWAFAIVLMVAFITVPYFLIIFVVSIICDKKVKSKKVLKNIIISILLLLPFLWVLKVDIYSRIDSNRVTYEYKDMSLTFPKDMKRIGTSKDFDDKYDLVKFTKDNCDITYAISNYRTEISLIENFKELSDRFSIIDNSSISIYDDFDLSYNLKYEYINGRPWNLYERGYNNLNYKLYGIRINNNFYKIEVKDNNSSSCSYLLKEVLDSVKYK